MSRAVAPLLLLGLLVPALLGCAPGFRRDNTDRIASTWRRVSLDAVPVILPPDQFGAPVGARMRRVGDIFESYVMVLANPTALAGENRLTMDVEEIPDSVFGALTRPTRPFPIPLYTEERLLATLKREFPGLETELPDFGRRNRYGDYDYAVAYANGGVTCVLAWQLIDDRQTLPETLAMIRLEYRRCGGARKPEDLLRPFEHLTLTAAADILPEDFDLETMPVPQVTPAPVMPRAPRGVLGPTTVAPSAVELDDPTGGTVRPPRGVTAPTPLAPRAPRGGLGPATGAPEAALGSGLGDDLGGGVTSGGVRVPRAVVAPPSSPFVVGN